MNRETEKALADRALALGRSADPGALPELVGLLATPSSEVRRLAVSAIGKLASLADPGVAVPALARMLRDGHPQVRQYTIKAMCAYGTHAAPVLQDLRDLTANPAEKDYNRRDAARAVGLIEAALRQATQQTTHTCQRCSVAVSPDEYARSQSLFQRTFCDKCFDETYIKRRNFDTRVEVSKTLRTSDGRLVQSVGERRVADWLAAHRIVYRYDDRLRILEGRQVRPDFYLPEFDVYIEYWGMDTLDYQIGMLVKKQMYQHAGKRLISLYPADLPELDRVLVEKLSRYVRLSTAPPDSASAPPTTASPGENNA